MLNHLANTTIAERLQSQTDQLTAAERKLAQALFADYPILGLKSMAEFAKAAAVSTPSVLRLVKKLGFSGFPAFQETLRLELQAQLQNPIAKHERWSTNAPQTHILNRFADAAMENLHASLQRIDHRMFDTVASLLGNPKQAVHIVGGRITGALAAYLHTHLLMARANVHLIAQTQNNWPQQLLNVQKNDVLLIFDVRRYDGKLLSFAALAKDRGCKVVLITDQWISPIARIASHTLPLRIEVPSSWDSNIVPMFVAESLVAAVVEKHWPETQKRITEHETLSENLRRPK